MDRDVRRKLEMGDRATVFVREHPATDPALALLELQLVEAMKKAKEVASRQIEADNRHHDRTAWRHEARQRLRPLVRALVKIGRAAVTVRPDLGPIFARVPSASSYQKFLPAVTTLVATCREQREALAPYGLGDALLTSAEEGLAQLVAAGVEAEKGRQARIGAGADLQLAVREVVSVVGRLHPLNQHRLASQPNLLSEWQSARRLGSKGPGGDAGESSGGAAASNGASAGGSSSDVKSA